MNIKGKKQVSAKKRPSICASEEKKDLHALLSQVGDKWSILLIVLLSRAPDQKARFSELLKLIDGISQRMLTTTLRSLERDGFVTREVFPVVPPKVEYYLTDFGKSLIPVIGAIGAWGDENDQRLRELIEKNILSS